MEDVITKVYSIGFDLWNTLLSVAVNLFTIDIRTAGTSAISGASSGTLYAQCYYIYTFIQDISIPIATVFFLIAIIKDVVSSPPEQQYKRFFADAFKFCVMLGILINLWDILGYVIQIATGFTKQIASAASTSISGSTFDKTSLCDAIKDVCEQEPKTSVAGITSMLSWLLEWVGIIFEQIALLIAGFITCLILISSGFTVLSSAYQRILKPLVILPFSSITVACATGSPEAERIATSYMKSLFGLLLAGAFMVICVSLGNVLASSDVLTDISKSYTDSAFGRAIFASVQFAITPVVVAGMVKSADSMLGRFL